MTQMDKRQQLIRLIHVAKRELKLTDDAYRHALAEAANGKESSAKMNIKELEAVLELFKAAGFKRKLNNKRRLSPPAGSRVRTAEVSVIRAVWTTMFKQGFLRDGSETALNSYTKRMTVKLNNGIGVDEVQWLNEHLAYKVLEALKKWHIRLMVDALKAADKPVPVNPLTRRVAGYEPVCGAYANLLKQQATK